MQSQGALGGDGQWLARQIWRRVGPFRFALEQAFGVQVLGHMGLWRLICLTLGRFGCGPFRGQGKIQQAMGVIKGRTQDLPARHILEGRGNAALTQHVARIDRFGIAETGQGGAIGPDQKDRFDQIAACLLDRQRREVGIKERSFGHDAVHRQPELLADLRDRKLGHRSIAPPHLSQPSMRMLDGPFAALGRHIHHSSPILVLRGRAAMRLPAQKI